MSRPRRRTFKCASRPLAEAGILKRGRKIFLALAFEFFLRGFESRHARRDFLTLAREPIVSFVHCPSVGFDSYSANIGVSNWGVNWMKRLQDCDSGL
jgi:hypothetical protein